jgi:CheY-like chemotaxis protein
MGDKEKEALQNQVQKLYTKIGDLSAKLNYNLPGMDGLSVIRMLKVC